MAATRRALSALLTLVLSFGLMPLTAFATQERANSGAGEEASVDVHAQELLVGTSGFLDSQNPGAGIETSVYAPNTEGGYTEKSDIASALAAAGASAASNAGGFSGGGMLSAQQDGNVVIVLDPGHGGYDSGAVGVGGFLEKDVNLRIAHYCREALEGVPGIIVYMTRTDDSTVELEERLAIAVDHNADLLVGIHNNAGGGAGADVIVPREGSWYYDTVYLVGQELGWRIMSALNSVGMGTHLGVWSRDATSGVTYPDGTLSDYYYLIGKPRQVGILGIIVEHAYVDNDWDAEFLWNEDNLRNLGEADARAILDYYRPDEAIANSYWGVYNHDYYLARNGDAQAAAGDDWRAAFKYFWRTGMNAAQQASPLFDVNFYRDTYGDVRDAFGGDLPSYYRHFVENGMREWRQGSAEFSPLYYKLNYEDLEQAFGWNAFDYYRHYLEYGKAEGRVADRLLSDEASDERGMLMQRLYNPNSGEHFYTSSRYERDSLIVAGWTYEGVGWVAPKTSTTPVYRLYNGFGGEHHYTLDAEERDMLVAAGWNNEGIGWYSDDAQAVPLYREYNPNQFSCNHNYTASVKENNDLYDYGWIVEGVAWYAVAADADNGDEVAKIDEPIMGESKATVEQMVKRYESTGQEYPSGVYSAYGAETIDDFCRILAEEAAVEGVRAEVVFAQAMKETGWLQFGGNVKAKQCNFAGLGVTGKKASGSSFNAYGSDSVRMGLRAQVQHLKAYASTDEPVNDIVDPRFSYVKRGSASYVKQLAGTWATDPTYGEALMIQIHALLQA